jgi:hypothetical protein
MGEMPVDFTFLEPDGLQVHIKLNSMLSKRGFFRGMSKEDKDAFDKEFEELISIYLPYTDETHAVNPTAAASQSPKPTE